MFELMVMFMGLPGPQSDDRLDEAEDANENDLLLEAEAKENVIPLHRFLEANGVSDDTDMILRHEDDHTPVEPEDDYEVIDLPVEDIPELGISIIQNNAAIHTIHAEDIPLPEQAASSAVNVQADDGVTVVDETLAAESDPAEDEKSDSDDDIDDETEVLTRYVSGNETGYNIAINFNGEWTSELQAAFVDSADHLSETILQDVPDVAGAYAADDIEIDASLVEIDGPGGILGQAGPTAIRTDSGLPVQGIMEFDAADAQTYSDAGVWEDIVFHEMMHTLGVGTLWDHAGLTEGSVAEGDLRFTGDMATQAYETEFDTIANVDPLSGTGVPIETHGSSGTAGGHWDEELFDDEIMTGYIDESNFTSEMTVASLEDMGYDTYLDNPASDTDATGHIPRNILSNIMRS